MDALTFCSLVDHTLLKPEATQMQIRALCAEATELRTRTVCVNGLWVCLASELLAGSGIGVCSVVGFPLGAVSRASVVAEASGAVEDGATEIDMVAPLGFVKDGSWAKVSQHLEAVRTCVSQECVLKVILEVALLSDEEIKIACRVAADAGADFVKTSTGFNPGGGATPGAVRLMRASVGPDVGVKAAGGIRTSLDALAMLDAGANRIGASATRVIAAEFA